MLKSAIDGMEKKKVKELIVQSAKEKGLDLESEMNDNINEKLDELMQVIIDDICYKKLAKMGLSLK